MPGIPVTREDIKLSVPANRAARARRSSVSCEEVLRSTSVGLVEYVKIVHADAWIRTLVLHCLFVLCPTLSACPFSGSLVLASARACLVLQGGGHGG